MYIVLIGFIYYVGTYQRSDYNISLHSLACKTTLWYLKIFNPLTHLAKLHQ